MTTRNGMFAGAFFLIALGVSATASADSLYERLGGAQVVSAVVADAVAKTNLPLAKDALTVRIYTLTGGGCKDSGAHDAHAGQPISNAEFSGLVEAMRESMRARDVPLAARNQLLEILAPMGRDVVTL